MSGVDIHSPSINIISLCTGGAGLDLGLELALPQARAGCYLEREAFAIAHLVAAIEQGFLAPAPIFSDVRSFNGRPWRGAVDCLIGGIPCQPWSNAGKRLGTDDERDLWGSARRIIAQARPWIVLIENVAGMLNAAGADNIAGAERVRRDLHRLGFTVETGLFTAAEVGAPHERERLFILGVADDAVRGWGAGASARGRDGESRADRGCRSDVADADRRQPSRWSSERPETSAGRPYSKPSGSGSGLQGQNVDLADADDTGLEGHRESIERPGECTAGSSSGELVNTASDGRREGRAEPEVRSGRDSAPVSSGAMANPDEWIEQCDAWSGADKGRCAEPRERWTRDQSTGSGRIMADAVSSGYDGRSDDSLGRAVQRDVAEGASGCASRAVADATREGGRSISIQPGRQDEAGGDVDGEGAVVVANPDISQLQREPSARQFSELQRYDALGLFPPGPADYEAWSIIAEHAPGFLPALSRYDRFMLEVRAAVAAAYGNPSARERLDEKGPYGLRKEVVQEIAQSALRGVDDGMAAARIDWLRLFGNGVVPIQAALAFRTLCSRLANRGSATAIELVRLMEAA